MPYWLSKCSITANSSSELKGLCSSGQLTSSRVTCGIAAEVSALSSTPGIGWFNALRIARIASMPSSHVFQLIGGGRSTHEIAQQLHLSIHTIESRRQNIRAKLKL